MWPSDSATAISNFMVFVRRARCSITKNYDADIEQGNPKPCLKFCSCF